MFAKKPPTAIVTLYELGQLEFTYHCSCQCNQSLFTLQQWLHQAIDIMLFEEAAGNG